MTNEEREAYLNVLLGDSDDESLALSDSEDENWLPMNDNSSSSSSEFEDDCRDASANITRSGRRSVRRNEDEVDLEESDDDINIGSEAVAAQAAGSESIFLFFSFIILL